MSRGSLVERVLGVTDPTNIDRAILQAHQTLSGEPFFNPTDPVLRPPTDPSRLEQWHDSLPRDSHQRALALSEVGDIIIRRDLRSASTLTDWPVYRGMMRQYGTKGDGTAKALMIGALNSFSSRSFKCLAEDEYGAGTTLVVDPVGGKDKVRHGYFVYGSGLALPIADASMDFVHTNQLLHMLRDPASDTAPQSYNVRKLVAEIVRVMAPGAQLLMKEILPNYEPPTENSKYDSMRALMESAQLAGSITRMLSQHGIEYVTSQIVKKPDGCEFLFDRNRDFDNYKQTFFPSTFVLFAQKRPQGPAIAL